MQDNINTLNKELVDAKISLDEIYLDPNNPRFTSLKWDDIPDQQISDASIQVATKRKLEEEFSIYKLVDNIQINGFLPIDRVIVKKFAENKYVVLEGNRRICAAKNIMELYKGNPEQVEESVVDSLKEISCLIYTGSERQPSWVFQGLRHIIGIQEWPAYNKARLLVQLMEDENLSLTEVGKKFGLTAYGAGQWVRGYYAFIQAAEESDYTQEIDERAYPYLQEIFSRSNPVFKDWLQWNDTEYKFEEACWSDWALERFIDGLRPVVEYAEKMGVLVAIEPVVRHIVCNPVRARKVLDEINSPNLRIILDPVNLLETYNYEKQDEIFDQAIELLGKDIAMIHFKDFLRKDAGGQLAATGAGQGGMEDYRTILRFAKQEKPWVFATLENTTPENSVQCLQYLQKQYDVC